MQRLDSRNEPRRSRDDDGAIEKEIRVTRSWGLPLPFRKGVPFPSVRREAKRGEEPFCRSRSLEQRTAKEHRGRFTIANYVAT